MSDMKELMENVKLKSKDKESKFYDLMSRLYDCVMSYDRIGLYNNKNRILLSNGDTINFSFPKNHISHLLGVDVDYFDNKNRFGSDLYSSFDKLKYFVENENEFKMLISDMDNMGNNPMFSKYIEEKVSVFLNNVKFKPYDVEFVIKYDPERVYLSEEHGDICDYYIVRKFEDTDTYGVIGLVEDKNSRYDDTYVPATSREYLTEDALDDFFKRIAKKQEIMYPVMHKITNYAANYENNYNAYSSVKKEHIKKLKEKSITYDCTPAVINDFDHTLNRADNKRHENSDILSVIKLLTNSIKSGNELDDDTIYYEIGSKELPLEITELIGLTNTMVNTVDVKGPEENNYFEVVDENKQLKERLEQATNKEKELDKMIEELTEDNNTKEEKLNEIKETCQKVLKKI